MAKPKLASTPVIPVYSDSQLQMAYDKAKIALMLKHNSTFIGMILFSLKMDFTHEVPTACVNGIWMKVNPDFFMSLSPEERVFLLAHESWHVAFDHMHRGLNKIAGKYNRAADYVINLMLTKASYSMPSGGLLDRQYEDMSTEQVYDKLPDDPTPPNWADLVMGSGMNSADQAAVTDIILRAALQAKASNQMDSVPQEIREHLDELLNPKLAWNVILQNHMSAYIKEDYSYRKPNRRYWPDFYLPSQHSPALLDIAIAVDSSASVSDEDFATFIEEVKYIKSMLNPRQIHIISFDTKIQTDQMIEEFTDIASLKFKGRGGTNLAPVIKFFNEHVPTVLIVFSDLDCKAIPVKHRPSYDVIWICVDRPNAEVEFGQLIHFSTKR
jgi:predicted metal-dependent peptidase